MLAVENKEECNAVSLDTTQVLYKVCHNELLKKLKKCLLIVISDGLGLTYGIGNFKSR